MIQALFVLASAVSVSAFVTPARTAAQSGLRMVADELIGADVETGGLWDPLGYTKNEDSLYQYRAAELKHGRCAMLAVTHAVTTQYFHLPDPAGVFSNNRPIGALLDVIEKRPAAFWQIIIAIGLVELTFGKQDTVNKAPGDLGFGEVFKNSDPVEFNAIQLKELKNGRLAMLASMGEIVQELLTKQGPVEQIIVGHISPFGDGQGFF